MTPAEELRAAAAKLREMAAAADTPGSWKANPLFRPLPGCRCLSCEEDKPWAWEIDVVDGPDNEACFHPMHIGRGDAEWIALMGPQRAGQLAVWLETEAHCLGVGDGVGEKAADLLDAIAGEPLKLSVTVVADTSVPALAFARSILGAAS
jgi:hypothetical protein